MKTNDKTLADVQPGGRVRLGGELPPLPYPNYPVSKTGLQNNAYTASQMWDYAIAALSAQPSPGGQGDAPEIEQIRTLVSSILSTVSLGHQKGPYAYAGEDFGRYLAEATRDCRAILRALSDLAARQPVGELHLPPDGFYKIVYDDAQVPDESFARTGALDAALRRFDQISANWNAHLFVRFANNTRDCTVPNATPAQAVDLGQFRPAVELMEWQERGHAHPDFPEGNPEKHAEALRLLALIDSQAVGK